MRAKRKLLAEWFDQEARGMIERAAKDFHGLDMPLPEAVVGPMAAQFRVIIRGMANSTVSRLASNEKAAREAFRSLLEPTLRKRVASGLS